MKTSVYITAFLLLVLIVSGCSFNMENYGRVRMVSGTNNGVTIQDLIDRWDDYNIYYAGYGVRFPLGIMFDPKDNDTTLVGERWRKVADKKTLIKITEWIYPTTQYEPWLSEILGPAGRFYGFLYYSYGFVVLKKMDQNTMCVLDLERPHEEGMGTKES